MNTQQQGGRAHSRQTSAPSLQLLAAACLVATLSGCSGGHPDVRPQANGLHRVIVRAPEKKQAEQGALNQAASYCKDGKKRAAIENEETKYTGTMSETKRNNIRQLSKATEVVGASINQRAFLRDGVGLEGVRGGNVAEDLGEAGQMATGSDDYVTTMTFRCL